MTEKGSQKGDGKVDGEGDGKVDGRLQNCIPPIPCQCFVLNRESFCDVFESFWGVEMGGWRGRRGGSLEGSRGGRGGGKGWLGSLPEAVEDIPIKLHQNFCGVCEADDLIEQKKAIQNTC